MELANKPAPLIIGRDHAGPGNDRPGQAVSMVRMRRN